MVTPEVYPQATAAAGCTAAYSVDHTDNSSGLGWSQSQTFYKLSASAAVGWRFDHFEWTRVTSGNGTTTRNYSFYDNPCTSNNLYEGFLDWGSEYEAIGFQDETTTVTYCRAVFDEVATYGDITVETSADPVAGGTTTPISETHQYAGSPSTTFTLTATPNAGYRFWRWELDDAAVGFSQTLTVTHYFTASPQTFHYVARFLPSSAILYGASGAILYGASGAIVHGG